ncbi:MAG: hypothetical protein IPL51_05715 [Candidatus Competibacteraceae bacterium]|nr:hypothetical protein [Candidatus Competibacteraceae bacterium]
MPTGEQIVLAERAVAMGWSVRELERQRKRLNDKPLRRGRSFQDRRNPDIQRLETRLRDWLCAPVRLKPNRNGGGKIEINYTNIAECEGVLERFGFKFDD